jgi:DNA mismatch repair protein MSH6
MQVLIEGGVQGASATLRLLLKSLQTNFSERRFLIETIQPNESFPQSTAIDPYIRKQLARSDIVHPWDVAETLTELHRRQYFPRASKIQSEKEDVLTVSRWPKVLRAAVEGKADLALSSFGAALFYLQRNLIDGELLSMGNVLAYIPPNMALASKSDEIISNEIDQLAVEHNFQQSGLSGSDLASSISQLHPEISSENGVTFMALDGTTLHNLEILTNSVDQKVTGSLWSKINYTKTPHGSRLLRAWLLRPLFCKHHIERRLDAVEELLGGSCAMALHEAKSILSKCGDIERLLSRVHSMSGEGVCNDHIHPNERAVLYETVTYTKRKVGDFAKVLHGLRYASQIPDIFCGIDIRSGLIRKIVQFSEQGGCFPRISDDLDWFFSNFDLDQAAKGFFEPGKGIDELYDTACDTVDRILMELRDYKDHMCSTVLTPRALAKSSWKYINIKPDSKDKYFIELPANIAVPDDFIMKGKRGAGPKQINKYLSPVVQQLVHEMERAYDVQKERKAKGMELIFAKFDSKRSVWEAVAHSTALLDALGSLAMTASKAGYVRPIILDCPTNSSPSISVLKGRHPCVENTFNSLEFIPNDLQLGLSSSCLNNTSAKVLLLSGPNMGVSINSKLLKCCDNFNG